MVGLIFCSFVTEELVVDSLWFRIALDPSPVRVYSQLPEMMVHILERKRKCLNNV